MNETFYYQYLLCAGSYHGHLSGCMGAQGWRGLAYAIGQGLVWPAVWFPSLGSIIGGLIWITIIVFLLILGLFMRKS